MKAIGLKAAIKLAETQYIDKQLNMYSIRYFKQDGTLRFKENICKTNPEPELEISEIKLNSSNFPKRVKYMQHETRTVGFFDLEAKEHFNISTDLWTEINGLIINHNK